MLYDQMVHHETAASAQACASARSAMTLVTQAAWSLAPSAQHFEIKLFPEKPERESSGT